MPQPRSTNQTAFHVPALCWHSSMGAIGSAQQLQRSRLPKPDPSRSLTPFYLSVAAITPSGDQSACARLQPKVLRASVGCGGHPQGHASFSPCGCGGAPFRLQPLWWWWLPFLYFSPLWFNHGDGGPSWASSCRGRTSSPGEGGGAGAAAGTSSWAGAPGAGWCRRCRTCRTRAARRQAGGRSTARGLR